MVKYPWEYEWSSARWHLRMSVRKYIKVNETSIVDRKYWKQYLMNSDEDIDNEIRRKTAKGKAFAGEAFISFWERELGSVLRELKSGPPKRKQAG